MFPLTLIRSIPAQHLVGVLGGAYRVFGGVIRNPQGRIVAHLIDSGSPLRLLGPLISGGDAALTGVNTYQLHRIGKSIASVAQEVSGLGEQVRRVDENLGLVQTATAHLLRLSQGTMLLSGLTLAVSAAGFAFLNRKLGRIDEGLQELQKEVKAIKKFLKTQQRGQLAQALKALDDVGEAPEGTRQRMVEDAHRRLGELHQHFKQELQDAPTQEELAASEEYFAITALSSARCSAELEMYPAASRDIREAYDCWSGACRTFAKERLLGNDAEKFLCQRYAKQAPTDQLVDWLEFANMEEKGLGWIDELRSRPSAKGWSRLIPFRSEALDPTEVRTVELLQRLASRDRVFQGYCAQYEFFREQKLKPSAFQTQVDLLDKSAAIEDTYILAPKDTSPPAGNT